MWLLPFVKHFDIYANVCTTFKANKESIRYQLISILGPPTCRTSVFSLHDIPDSKVHGDHMGPTWALSAPAGPHGVPMNLAISNVSAVKPDHWRTVELSSRDHQSAGHARDGYMMLNLYQLLPCYSMRRGCHRYFLQSISFVLEKNCLEWFIL